MQSGRVDANRPAPIRSGLRLRALGGGAALCLLSACAAGRSLDPQLAPLWRDYQALPEQRALAVAGELRQQRWVAGASGGHASAAEAEAAALSECRRRRARQRMRAPCLLYASGDEVVWPAP